MEPFVNGLSRLPSITAKTVAMPGIKVVLGSNHGAGIDVCVNV